MNDERPAGGLLDGSFNVKDAPRSGRRSAEKAGESLRASRAQEVVGTGRKTATAVKGTDGNLLKGKVGRLPRPKAGCLDAARIDPVKFDRPNYRPRRSAGTEGSGTDGK